MTKTEYLQLAACICKQQREAKLFDGILYLDFDLISKEEVDSFKEKVPRKYKDRYNEIVNEYNEKLEALKNEIFDEQF
ncbi:hypothetical protein AB3329_01725 [Streptococcus sp. H31]|uniref:hypothetical protein n=1 Tax=Streptococcus huangxiaojuni TaxID=3237239 RepID=UPI0034A51C98